MNKAFHLDDATVVAYAGGSLSNCLSVVAASHVAMCDHCRAKVRKAEAVGAALLETSELQQMKPDALSSVFERIDGSDWVQPKSRSDVSDDPAIKLFNGFFRVVAQMLRIAFIDISRFTVG